MSVSNIYAQEGNPSEEGISSDTTAVADTVQVNPKSDVETTIIYSARDSIIREGNIVRLYGAAHIKYGSIELDAARIIIDYNGQTLSATGVIDTLGRMVDKPIFKNGAEVYETTNMVYNFKTGKARISEVVTQQGEGYLHGKKVFKSKENVLFSFDNTYTTCDLPHPHYQIRARKTKAIPDDKIVAGLFNLEINDVPTPIGFPFGMFPAQKEAASGIIIPSYGEEQRRGFFLRSGGYYFDISEYVNLSITGDLYSKGGHGLYINSDYNKRYAYRGGFNFSYTQYRDVDLVEDQEVQNDYRLRWNHSPQSKGNSRFSASIDAATATFTQNNYLGVRANPETGGLDNLSRKLQSSVQYQKTFGSSPFSMAISGRHTQDLITKDLSLSLPELSFTMSNIYPFQQASDIDVLEKFNVRYSLNGINRITNIISPDSVAPFNFETLPYLLDDAQIGVRHVIPVSTTFNLFKYFAVSPTFNYRELWYFKRLNWELDPETQRPVAVDTITGFNRSYDYNFNTAINTRVYGTYFFKSGKIKAIRHMINPQVSLQYAPDFADPKYGFYQTFVNERGQEFDQSIHQGQGFAYGSVSNGRSGSIGFGLNNTLEMKVQTKGDSVNNVKKVNLLNNFSISSSYNFLAEEFKLSPISLRANTSLFDNKVNFSFNGIIDPYLYRLDSVGHDTKDEPIFYQEQIDQLSFKSGEGFGRLSSMNFNISTNLNPEARKTEAEAKEQINDSNLSEYEKDYAFFEAEEYIDFSIPWSLRVDYTLSFTKDGFAPREMTANSIQFSGNLSLTEKWKVTFRSGYSFVNDNISLTDIGVVRDLHCWTLNFSWVPWGSFANYNVTIQVKSSLLSDLKLNRRRSFFDNIN